MRGLVSGAGMISNLADRVDVARGNLMGRFERLAAVKRLREASVTGGEDWVVIVVVVLYT